MIDPIEGYTYPKEWIKKRVEKEGFREVKRKIKSGLYILTKDGWLKRGITTATTTTASILGAISSLYEREVSRVEVETPIGIYVEVDVHTSDGIAKAIKFAGDHAFDITDGIEVICKVKKKGERRIIFGKGIGLLNGKKAVSESAMKQIEKNFKRQIEMYGYDGDVFIEIPMGEVIAKKTSNSKFGIRNGISILGTTGFVEPWCGKLVETKISLLERYDKIAITTGRNGWRYALENLKGYQPFVFGVYIEDALKFAKGEIILIGKPSLLVKWAIPELRGKVLRGESVLKENVKYRQRVLEKAREINENVSDVILI